MIADMIAAHLPELRAQSESLMTDAGTINTIVLVFDPATNRDVETLTPTYSGRLRVWRGNASSTTDTGGQQVTTVPLLCAVPWDVTGIEPGQVVVVSASADPRLIGRRLTVRDVSSASQPVRRLLTVVDDQG